MQSWNAAPNGAHAQDTHNTWDPEYGFQGNSGQFHDETQTWNQSVPSQQMYSSIGQSASPHATSYYPSGSHTGGPLVNDGTNGMSSIPPTNFPGQTNLQQHYQGGQDALDPAFSMQHGIYNQDRDLNLRPAGVSEMGRVPGHQHQSPVQNFQQKPYPAYSQGTEQPFQSPSPFPAAQPAARQHSNQPTVQRPSFESMPQQQQRTPQQQQQQAYQHAQAFQPPQQPVSRTPSFDHASPVYHQAVNAQNASYPTPSASSFTQPLPQYQQAYFQPQPLPQTHGEPNPKPPTSQASNPAQPFINSPNVAPPPVHTVAARSASGQGIKRTAEQTGTPPTPQDPSDANGSGEPAVKKRKRVTKKILESEGDGSPQPQPVAMTKPAGDMDSVPLPTSTAEELSAMQQFKKRTSADRGSFPIVQGATRLVSNRRVLLPAPKSYDKLVPLVAAPSSSQKPILSELGRSLPCEIQGRFMTSFKPSPSGAGLDDRRNEAQGLLAEFDKSMGALGKLRPKYTEYPHAFKEQLKADESSRTKAERLARKLAEEEERNKPVRPEVRPSDPVEGAAWDIIGIVHIESSANRTTALLAGAVQATGDYIIARRGEMVRAKQELDQAAQEKRESELPSLQQDLELKKNVLRRTLETAVELGDEVVLESLGEHQRLVTGLVNALIYCIKAGDFSGKLTKATLGLLTKFKVTPKVAKLTVFENVRKRLIDKGDDEVKQLTASFASKLKKALDVEASSKKPSTATSATSSTVAPKANAKSSALKTAAAKLPVEGPSAKRNRVDEGEPRAAKKQAMESATSADRTSKPTATGTTQPKPTVVKPRSIGGILPGKSRPVAKLPAAKPEPNKVESAKVEAPKDKSGAKLEVKKISRPEMKKTEPAKTAKPSSSSGGIGGIASLLNSINAPKAMPKKPAENEPKEEPKKDETPEEKAKRLRKEARRDLRVTWKADHELEQVRTFHQEEEEGGLDTRMIRDAADDKREGMVLKQGRAMAEEEDEDEDDLPYRPWLEPVAIDFSRIPTDFKKKTYATKGGDIAVDTDEQKSIAEREQRELMAFYQDSSDIPPTPKSPPLHRATAAPSSETKIGHLPRDDAKFEEIHRRWKETQQLGRDAALQYAIKRIESQRSHKAGPNVDQMRLGSAVPTTAMSAALFAADPRTGVSAFSTMNPADQIIALLSSDVAKQWRTTEPQNGTHRRSDYADPRVQHAADIVEEVAAKLSGPYPATEPPEWFRDNAESVREWWLGYNKDLAAKAKKEAEEQARIEAERVASAQAQANADAWAAYYAQQQAYAPYMAMLQQMQAGQAPQAATPAQAGQATGNDQLQAVLAALGHAPGQGPAPAANTNPQLHPNDPSYEQLMMLTQMAGQQAVGEQINREGHGRGSGRDWDREHDRDRDRDRDRNRERDRDRDWDRDGDRDRESRHGGGGGQRKAKGPGNLGPHRPVNRALIGTKPCMFFKQGVCARGDQCTFRHE